ncbi:MAG: CoA-binding protein [Chloroflexi bacterium]|nr:CoA-binding protein [Chloroflexota bacterium]
MKVDFSKLDRAFNPKCVAVVGDKQESNFNWLRSHSSFKGKLCSVQIDPREIEGIKALGVTNYLSLMDVPEPVDLAIVAVPRTVATRVLEDCIRKELPAAHFYTAGFSESESEEGIRLERLLTERAEQTNFHLIGPNCMGVFNPRIGLGMGAAQLGEFTGQVGFISQSGSHAVTFNREAHLQGVNINKSVSLGNGVVLGPSEYLEYFGHDPEIKMIGMFLEGVRDMRRFLKVLREVSARKPVVIWKGGRTEAGKRAIASHTASLAVSHAIWNAAVKQSGAIQASSMEELIDVLKALLYLPSIYGDRVAITGGSGGQSVALTDVFSEAGLTVPLLAKESLDELATIYTRVGGGYHNPVDTANPSNKHMKRIVEILMRDTNTDNLVLLMGARGATGPISDLIESMVDLRRKTSKPLTVILSCSFTPEQVQNARDIMHKLQDGGIPAFLSLERGASALRKALDYYRLKQSIAQ